MRTFRLLPSSVPEGVSLSRGISVTETPPVDRQTPVKTWPSQISFAGSNNVTYAHFHSFYDKTMTT